MGSKLEQNSMPKRDNDIRDFVSELGIYDAQFT